MTRSPCATARRPRVLRGVVACAAALGLLVARAGADVHLSLTVVDGGDVRVFDIATLQGMKPVDIDTATPWTDSTERFTGIPLARLLAAPPAGGGTLRLIALNDYQIAMPLSELAAEVPIVAFFRDGQPMSIRDKGPFWIIYPFDAGAAFQSEQVFSRSVWQLVRVEVER